MKGVTMRNKERVRGFNRRVMGTEGVSGEMERIRREGNGLTREEVEGMWEALDERGFGKKEVD